MDENQIDFDWYFKKLLTYQNRTECYQQLISNKDTIVKAANKLKEYLEGRATQQEFTALCAGCYQATLNLIGALNSGNECDALGLISEGHIQTGYF